jgi:outer membrane protein assembly factor BamD (BamD/ComL family)
MIYCYGNHLLEKKKYSKAEDIFTGLLSQAQQSEDVDHETIGLAYNRIGETFNQ